MWPDQTEPQNPLIFLYGALLRPMLRARTVSGATGGFLWDNGTPSYIKGTRQWSHNLSKPPKYRKIHEKYRNTCERHLLKTSILALIKKHIHSEDDLEKPRGKRSSYKHRRLICRLILLFTGCTGLIVLKVFSKLS